jgi:chromosome segregation ATPase
MKTYRLAPFRKREVLALLMVGTLWLLQARVTPAAEEKQTIETQLRDKLRATLLELRAAETDRAALQAAQAQSADENKALTERIQAITKEANANKLAAQTAAQAADSLKSQVSRQENEIAQLKETIESSKQAAELAHNKEEERIKLADNTVIELERLVADRQAKNLTLYKIAVEILERYQRFGLGDALKAREPFVGVTRVKLQNLVQDYQDKLLNERTTLTRKDLPAYGDKLVSPPRQTADSSAGLPKQTSE